MLSVIILILKIIGTIILVLLCMLILLILVVLFVPIRYNVTVEHGDSFVLDGGVSWLLHLLHARIHQSDNNHRIWVRIFGILVYDSLRPPKTKKDIAKKKLKTAHKKKASSKDIKSNVEESIKRESIKRESIRNDNVRNEEIRNEEIRNEEIRNEEIRNEEIRNEEIKNEEIRNEEIRNNDIKNNDIKINESEYEDIEGDIEGDIEEEDFEKEGIGFDGKINKVIIKIKTKMNGLFQGLKCKLMDLFHKLRNIKNKVDLILNFIRDDINKEGFLYTYGSLKKLIKHILPRKIKSRLIFGTGDPCSTGKALGVFGILYSIYGDNLQITPDFENKVFKGSHYARGRIRIWTILIIVIKLLLDKRFKELKMNYQILKEAL